MLQSKNLSMYASNVSVENKSASISGFQHKFNKCYGLNSISARFFVSS
ncbi:hypothetical protein [Marinifilum caeruleilacunae]|nr:hypothetical protein [Marinifilum caeruleilacunae]